MPSLADLRRVFYITQLGLDPDVALSNADLETLYVSGIALNTVSVVRTTDSAAKNNSAVAAADSLLKFDAEANSTYMVEGLIIYTSSAVADFRWTVTAPAGATGGFTSTGPTATIGYNQDSGTAGALAGLGVETITGGSGVSAYSIAEFRAYVITTDAGVVAFSWGQWTADPTNTVVRKGSLLKYRKAA